MTILDQRIDMSNKWRTLIELSDGTIVTYISINEPTIQELLDFETQWIEEHQYDNANPMVHDINDERDVIEEFVTLIKQNPTVNLTQYNNWLSTQDWQKSAYIRFFVFKLATFLAQENDIILDDLTETQVLLKLRNWIVASPVSKIERVVFNM